MRDFQVSRYIKKWLPWIVALCVLATVGVYAVLSLQQVYVASAVIQYNGEEAKSGLTPLQTELDVNEIRSSAIMSKVLGNLELDSKKYSVDDLISRMSVNEVLDADEATRKTALLDEGQEYTVEPTMYIVSFKATNDEGESFARKVLDEALDVYFSQYSEKYINYGTLANSLDKLDSGNYDYIEMMEIIEENISQTLDSLGERSSNSPYFRSAQTGMTFNDLASEFYYIRSTRISDLYTDIFGYQITRDKALLRARYSDKIRANTISNQVDQERIDDVMMLIEEYVEKMRNSDNTNVQDEYILDDVYSKDLTDYKGNLIGAGDQTVTYDKLIYSWSDYNTKMAYDTINSAYYQYVMDAFSSCVSDCPLKNPAAAAIEATPAEAADDPQAAVQETTAETQKAEHVCADSPLTCAAQNTEGYAQIVEQVDAKIAALISEMGALYDLVDQTNAEYNDYIGAKNISMLSTVSITESLNVKLYTALAAVFLLMICCCGAILIGRLNDIIAYTFFTDHLTGMKNHAAFDNYLKSRQKSILGNSTACFVLAVVNQAAVNQKHGREVGDQLIKFIAGVLKDATGKSEAELVYNGGAQFIVVADGYDEKSGEELANYIQLMIDKRTVLREVCIQYDMGYALSGADDAHLIRGLLSKAISKQERKQSPAEVQE